MKKIGVVGLGVMGSGIASNFLKNKYEVFVWNRTQDKAEKLANQDAIICSSPAEVAQKADIVFEVTANDESSRLVWEGESGIFSSAKQDGIYITCSTLSIGRIDELIKYSKESGITYCDMAMTGGRIAAETGNLTLLCGGEKQVVDDLKPILSSIAGKILYFGEVGSGARYKLILNFLQAVHIIGFGQAMKIAESYKMDLNVVAQSLSDRPGGVITAIAEKAYFQEPDPTTFSIEWITKDLEYAKKMTDKLELGLLDEVLKQYKKGLDSGFAKKDWASINKLI